MRFPSKLFQFRETVIYDCNIIMDEIKEDISVLELYEACKNKCNGVQGFFDALDVLYAMNKIEYNYTTRRVSNVKGNNL